MLINSYAGQQMVVCGPRTYEDASRIVGRSVDDERRLGKTGDERSIETTASIFETGHTLA